ncbi:MAG: type II toxin-antitoxin system prevent-host-death family antitoxin [Terracidiphilus sp.]|jgi:prevent-host-death family protein
MPTATVSANSQTVNIYEAKTKLSKLVDLAAAGQEIIIARNGKPVARLTTIEQPKKKPIVYGLLEGKGWIADDFDDPLPEEIQKYFEGRGDDE